MAATPAPSLLVVGIDVPADSERASYVYADSPGRALELIKLLRVDLVVVPSPIHDMPLPTFVRYLRAVSPWQKWVLAAGPETTAQDELAARCNGVLAVIDADWQSPSADWSEIERVAGNVNRRTPARLTGAVDG